MAFLFSPCYLFPAKLGDRQPCAGHVLFLWRQYEGSGLSPLSDKIKNSSWFTFPWRKSNNMQVQVHMPRAHIVFSSYWFSVRQFRWVILPSAVTETQHCCKFNRMAQWPLDKLINHQKRQFDTAAGRLYQMGIALWQFPGFSCLCICRWNIQKIYKPNPVLMDIYKDWTGHVCIKTVPINLPRFFVCDI